MTDRPPRPKPQGELGRRSPANRDSWLYNYARIKEREYSGQEPRMSARAWNELARDLQRIHRDLSPREEEYS